MTRDFVLLAGWMIAMLGLFLAWGVQLEGKPVPWPLVAVPVCLMVALFVGGVVL